MIIFYGLTNDSQFRLLPEGINITISARWLMKSQSARKSLLKYRTKFQSLLLDSGAFGAYFYDKGYTYTPDEYFKLVEEIDADFWVTMDIPCDVQSSMMVKERIVRTVENTRNLCNRRDGFISVVQGWDINDYIFCLNLLREHSLITPIMGIGSICRRFAQSEIVGIARNIKANIPETVKLHGFGVKLSALYWNNGEIRNYLSSVDTAAWQFNIAGSGNHWRIKKCSEIPFFFEQYQKRMEAILEGPYQLTVL
jgi:hypothetical protein